MMKPLTLSVDCQFLEFPFVLLFEKIKLDTRTDDWEILY